MGRKRKHEYAVPQWLKLDNAAKIYPPSRTRDWAAMFRLSVTLREPIDPKLLERAQAATLKRMPSFAYRLRRGFFWYYLERLDGAPPLQQDVANPMVSMNFKQNRYFMFRVRYYDCRIAIEIFHALTDGTGGLTFLLTMTAEYLRLKYGVAIEPSGHILAINAPVRAEEIEDSFLRYARDASIGRYEAPGYTMHGIVDDPLDLHIVSGALPASALVDKAHAYGVTVTMLLSSILIKTLLNIQKKDPSARRRRQMVKVSIPINLRPYYDAVTLRNFASYINVGVSGALGDYTLDEILNQVKHQMGMEITEKRLNARFSGNVGSEKHPIIRGLPLVIKAPFLKMMYMLQGDRYSSITLSNLGLVKLPESMLPYVRRMDFVLGAPNGNPENAAMVGVGDSVYINFSRLIREPDIEREFFRTLVKLGIPVRIESNRR